MAIAKRHGHDCCDGNYIACFHSVWLTFSPYYCYCLSSFLSLSKWRSLSLYVEALLANKTLGCFWQYRKSLTLTKTIQSHCPGSGELRWDAMIWLWQEMRPYKQKTRKDIFCAPTTTISFRDQAEREKNKVISDHYGEQENCWHRWTCFKLGTKANRAKT